MKIVKRLGACPICTMTLWLIPTLSYTFMSVNGVKFHNEWIWWVGIPTLMLVWGLLNWKIEK